MTSWACPAPSSGLAEALAEEDTLPGCPFLRIRCLRFWFKSCSATDWPCVLGQLSLSDLGVTWTRLTTMPAEG